MSDSITPNPPPSDPAPVTPPAGAIIPEANRNVRDLLIEDEMRESYMRYSMSVIVSRALPDVRDGLKPSQRRILVAMNDLNLSPRTKFRKCAKICGDASGNYHPHGEAVVYPTLVRMAQDFVMREILAEPQGNFGSLDDPPAAMRYTESRLSEAAMDMLADLEEDTVDFVPNYDERLLEPTVLPGRFPNLLVNGAQGIAVGMASSIPPHNVREVCEAAIALIDNSAITLPELMVHVKGPDFPTGAMICGRSGILDAYETGRGHLLLRAKCRVEEGKNDKMTLIFTELPYGVSVNTILEQVVSIVNQKKMTSIADARDESSMADGTRLIIELKRGENDQVALNQLYKMTRLEETFGVIMIALVDGRPETLGLKQLLECFRDHRVIVIRRRTHFRLRKAEAREHIVAGLIQALDVIDWIITTIRTSRTVAEAKDCLTAGIDPAGVAAVNAQGHRITFSTLQAEAILEMRLARLTGLEREKLLAEWEELRKEIAEYKAILADHGRVLAIIKDELRAVIAKFPSPRRTEIGAGANEVRMEDLIDDTQVAVTISHEGYVKRLALTEYRIQGRGGKGVTGADMKEGDFVERLIVTTNHQYLLVLTQTGQMHWLRVFDIPEGSRTSRGRALVNMLQIAQGDRIAACVPVRSFDAGYLITATKMGTVRKTPLSGFSRPRQGGIIGVLIEEGDALIGAAALMPGQEVVLTTANGKAIHFMEKAVRSTGRASVGVRGVRLVGDDRLVSLVVVEPGKQLLTVCEKGFGKRTAIEEYPIKNRGGQGVIGIQVTERNGRVVGTKCVAETDEFIMITEKGMVVRSAIADVRVIGRNTQGVRLMNVEDDDRVVSIGLVETEEETPIAVAAGETEAATDDAGDGAEDGADDGAEDAAGADDGTDDTAEPGAGDAN